jgi:hypothetical protein
MDCVKVTETNTRGEGSKGLSEYRKTFFGVHVYRRRSNPGPRAY